jgi:hypothetical protein
MGEIVLIKKMQNGFQSCENWFMYLQILPTGNKTDTCDTSLFMQTLQQYFPSAYSSQVGETIILK